MGENTLGSSAKTLQQRSGANTVFSDTGLKSLAELIKTKRPEIQIRLTVGELYNIWLGIYSLVNSKISDAVMLEIDLTAEEIVQDIIPHKIAVALNLQPEDLTVDDIVMIYKTVSQITACLINSISFSILRTEVENVLTQTIPRHYLIEGQDFKAIPSTEVLIQDSIEEIQVQVYGESISRKVNRVNSIKYYDGIRYVLEGRGRELFLQILSGLIQEVKEKDSCEILLESLDEKDAKMIVRCLNFNQQSTTVDYPTALIDMVSSKGAFRQPFVHILHQLGVEVLEDASKTGRTLQNIPYSKR